MEVNYVTVVNRTRLYSHLTYSRAHTYDQTDKEATVTFFDGSTDSADVIVCADGIHSTGKDYIIGDDELAAPTHSGYCVYYGIVPQPWA